MIQKEVNEIKKTLRSDNSAITRIGVCYVDTEKEIKVKKKEALLALEEGEQDMYFELFRAALSGKIGGKLLNLSIPAKEEQEGGKQSDLYKLLKTDLDDELLDKLYEKIIDSYAYVDNFVIIVAKGNYDIKKKSMNDEDLDDSENVYEHLLCLICPVKAQKSGLVYDALNQNITNALQNKLVEKPLHAFLFPSFNDRDMDIHEALYYMKKAEEPSASLIEGVLGCQTPKTGPEQKEIIVDALTRGLGEDCTFETVKDLCGGISEDQAATDKPDIDKAKLEDLLSNAGASVSQTEEVQAVIDEQLPKGESLIADNIFSGKKLEVKNGYLDLKIDVSHRGDISVENVNGAQCIVVRINEPLQMNGIPLS